MSPPVAELMRSGLAHHQSGRLQEAESAYRSVLDAEPENPDALYLLGVLSVQSGRREEAIEQFRKAIVIAPDNAAAHGSLASAFHDMGRLEDAVFHYRKALAIRPDFVVGHYNVGIALDELQRPEEACVHYNQALAINPDYAEAHHNLANSLDELGRGEDAIRHYERALAIKPDYAEAHRNLTRLKPDKSRIPEIMKLLDNPATSDADTVHCHFALGRIHHDGGSADEAFQHYVRGNSLKRETLAYDSQALTAYVDGLIATYTAEYFRSVEASGSESELPVFIVGMPRSGTTLVEQILSSHAMVHGAGELESIARIEKAVADEPAESVAANFAPAYLEELRRHSSDAVRITDKMPDNFMRIGLIKTLFPNARIIHCKRNALDTCASNFLSYFATGNEYSFDLNDLGRYYLDYERIMAHWSKLFSAEIIEVRYEELLLNQEEISRQLIDCLDLDWDDNCLEFYNNDRAVHNFSSAQVRQPVYTHSVNRWKHYDKQLLPLVETLLGHYVPSS